MDSAAAGPSAIPTATARLSSTTGLGLIAPSAGWDRLCSAMVLRALKPSTMPNTQPKPARGVEQVFGDSYVGATS